MTQTQAQEIGRPKFFDVKLYAEAVESMIRADEVQIALQMLEQVPSFYREPQNYPQELASIKATLYRQLYSSIEYATDDEEFEFTCQPEIGAQQWTSPYCEPRGEIISQAVHAANINGSIPFIVDLGSSHGNMPHGLLKLGFKFNYKGLAPNHRTTVKLKELLGDVWRETPAEGQEVWLVCSEVLEHCMDPMSLIIDAKKFGHDYAQVFWSTPLNTLYGGLENYHSRRLGHVRCWNAAEFRDFVTKHFPGYKWAHFLSHSQVLHGKKAS